MTSAARVLSDRIRPARMQFGLTTVLWASIAPLLLRVGRGEGQILAVNLSIVWFSGVDAATLAVHTVVSGWTLTLLYLWNDLYDCRGDLADPDKDAAFVRFCVDHRRWLFGWLAVQKAVLVALAWFALGLPSALAIAAVTLVNAVYSARLKGVAGIDVVWVGLWGGMYAAVVGAGVPFFLLALVGVMTSVCHVFQVARDRTVDARNEIRTSAVAAPWLPAAELAICAAGLGLLLYPTLGVWGAVSGATPLGLYLLLASNQRAWLLSKLYYGIVWLCVLVTTYGL